MTVLTLKINDKDINIDVPCTTRATCYKNLLIEILGQLYDTFRRNIFLEKVILEPSLIEGLVKTLDQEVCRYIDQDLVAYREVLKRTGESSSKKKLTPIETREALTKYYNDRSKGHESYGAYLKKTFPTLASLLTLLSKQFQEAMAKALTRISNDEDGLQKLFLPNHSDKHYFLARIISTHNDLHKAGQQVLVLEFKPENQIAETGKEKEALKVNEAAQGEKIRLIYKPASVLVDMMFLGNIQKLKDCGIQNMPQLESAQSITEIINTTIEGKYKLPSYIIYPREDENIIDSYGYIEYLPHHPWPENLEKKILAAIEREQDEAEAQNRKLGNLFAIAQKVIEKQFDNILIEAQKRIQENDLSCDYIAKNQEEHLCYSYQCGVLAAMATALGITDMHIQNLIVSRIQPYLIDLEVSFNQVEASVKATGLLDPVTGSMLKRAIESTSLYFLNSIEGLDQVGINLPQKNQFYLFNPNGPKPMLVNPETEIFNQGFIYFMELLTHKNESFRQWLAHPLVQSMSVRILPYATSDFIDWLSQYKFEDFQFLSADEQSEKLEKEKEIFFIDLLKQQVMAVMDSNTSEPVLAVFNPVNIKDNFDSLNIPVFYMKAGENRLIDSAGDTVEINYKRIAELCELEEDESQKLSDLFPHTHYFNTTPLEFIVNQINKIGNDPEYREKLIKTANAQTQEAFKESQPNSHTASSHDADQAQELSRTHLPENAPASSSSEARSVKNPNERSALLFYKESGQIRHKSNDKCCTTCTIL